MISLGLEAVSLVAPGLEGWQGSEPVLRGARAYEARPLSAFNSELLPRNERRRTTGAIKLALRAGDEIMRQCRLDLAQVRSVFASSAGDGEIIHSICAALARPDRAVSPTQFHNSVHNGPAGYWAIALQCRMSSVSLSAYDGSFAAALLEAATLVTVERAPVLLVAYDHPQPNPLSRVRHIEAPFAVAMLIHPQSDEGRVAAMVVEITGAEHEDTLADEGLERMRIGNPAARALPLLQALARREARRILLPYLPDRRLRVSVQSASEQRS